MVTMESEIVSATFLIPAQNLELTFWSVRDARADDVMEAGNVLRPWTQVSARARLADMSRERTS
jgi:hypothetical protein